MQDLSVPKKWILPKVQDLDPINQILVNRGIIGKEAQQRFLHPDFDRDFLDPFLIKDMEKAARRILKAIANNEKIGIFGDYDADGIPATALLIRGLSLLKFQNIYPIIPTRAAGYGLNNDVVDELINNNCQLLVTIDNGIAAKESIKYALGNKIETIVVDHHLIQPDFKPDALAIINPKQDNCMYPEKNLSACGLVFKLLWAIFVRLDKSTAQLKWLLDLVGISTIADLVPLLGENRLLAYYGLIVLQKTRNLGLAELYKSANINPELIDAYTVGFIIAPRLNAPSRMGREKTLADHPNMILDLLTTCDQERAKQLSEIIAEVNTTRQEILEKIVKEASLKAKKLVEAGRLVIVLYDEKWPEGVVGLVASRLVEQFHRPAFVLGGKGETIVGSARSIKNFHLVDSLAVANKLLLRFGGHALAAGLSLEKKNLEKFSQKIENRASQILSDVDFVKIINIDSQINIKEIEVSLAQKIQKLAPFGMGNPQPIFLLDGRVDNIRLMGTEKQHLSFVLRSTNHEVKVVAFSNAKLADHLQKVANIELIGNIKINRWQDKETAQLMFLDYRERSN